MAKILLLNGPNLNLLGSRQPELYGHTTLGDIEQRVREQAGEHGHELEALQSNAEHELVERTQAAAGDGTAMMLVNPAALTHTSVAWRDALLAAAVPFIEVHLTNIHAREPFRRQSFFSDIAIGTITGMGPLGYELALSAAIRHLEQRHDRR